MKRIISFLVYLAVWLTPAFGGGALYFDGSAYYDCSTYSMPDIKHLGVMAFVTPDFDSSHSTTRAIIGNFDNTGCQQGFMLFWRGGSTEFAAQAAASNCCGACPPNTPVPIFVRSGAPSFSAGDLLGIFAVLKDGLQSIEVVNYSTGSGVSASEFRGWDPLRQNLGALQIADGGNNSAVPWLGKIHLIVLQAGESKNSNQHQLDAVSKFRFWPMYTGTANLNGTGGQQDLDGVWLFEDEKVATLRNELADDTDLVYGLDYLNIQCTAVGTPVPAGSEMMR